MSGVGWKGCIGERKLSLFERDAVDGELLHCSLADAHVGDHGLHLRSLALQHHIQTAAEPETLTHLNEHKFAFDSDFENLRFLNSVFSSHRMIPATFQRFSF